MTGPSDSHSRIVWDDTQVRTTRPEVWNVTGTREEIALVFGTVPGQEEGRQKDMIDFTDRIVLNPFVAKRLALSLDRAIRHYESRYGPIEVESGAPAGRGMADETERSEERAELLFRLTKDLGVSLGFERSFKVFERTLLANRFLLGASKKALGDNSRERILAICAEMGMPADLLESLDGHLPDSNFVHFGFEKSETARVYKVYLEFYDKIEGEMKAGPRGAGPFLMHLGFKWDISDSSKRVLTRYTWYPSLSLQGMARRLSRLLDPRRHGACLEIAKGILSLASRKVPHEDILYLEVTEEGYPRRSFDINMYRANLRMDELYPFLDRMCRIYSISQGQFQALYERAKEKAFGHLSGGIDREGRDFLTVYYGVERIRGNSTESGISGAEASRETWAGRTQSSRQRPEFQGVEKTDEKAGALFRLVNSLDVKVGLERSFKVLAGTFLPNRFLLGFRGKDMKEDSHEAIVDICRQIDMPGDFLNAFQDHLPESNIVLFGFEGNETARLYKAYLEFGDRIAEVLKENRENPRPFPIHMAFKWDVSDNSRKTMGEYICFPGLGLQDMMARLVEGFYPRRRKNPFRIVEGIIRMAAGRADPSQWIYFEADEPGNPRESFDINLYRANLQVREIYPFLLDMMRHYSIPDEQFHDLYDAVGPLVFGHLTGGIDRQGRDFLTVYFGEKGSSGQDAGK
ncbi:MAG: DUF3467 domain-containing protein [Thermodesulfobacteriota bacterium]